MIDEVLLNKEIESISSVVRNNFSKKDVESCLYSGYRAAQREYKNKNNTSDFDKKKEKNRLFQRKQVV